MNILIMTIPLSLTLGILFLLFFLSAAKTEQFEDLDTPAHLPLSDDDESEGLKSSDHLKKFLTKKNGDS